MPPSHWYAALQNFDEDVDCNPPVGVEETPILLSERCVQDPNNFEKDVGLNQRFLVAGRLEVERYSH